ELLADAAIHCVAVHLRCPGDVFDGHAAHRVDEDLVVVGAADGVAFDDLAEVFKLLGRHLALAHAVDEVHAPDADDVVGATGNLGGPSLVDAAGIGDVAGALDEAFFNGKVGRADDDRAGLDPLVGDERVVFSSGGARDSNAHDVTAFDGLLQGDRKST